MEKKPPTICVYCNTLTLTIWQNWHVLYFLVAQDEDIVIMLPKCQAICQVRFFGPSVAICILCDIGIRLSPRMFLSFVTVNDSFALKLLP